MTERRETKMKRLHIEFDISIPDTCGGQAIADKREFMKTYLETVLPANLNMFCAAFGTDGGKTKVSDVRIAEVV